MSCSSSDRESMITYAGKILDNHEEFNDKYALAELVLKCTSKKGTMHENNLR